mgnify:CR=1 FL=1
MIKNPLILAAISIITSCSSNSLEIDINLENFVPSEGEGMASINVRDSTEWVVVDSMKLINGKGKLSFSPKGPTSFYLTISGMPESIAGFGYQGKLSLTGDASVFPFQGKLAGTESQDNLNEYMLKRERFKNFTDGLRETYSIAAAAGDSKILDSLTAVMDVRYSQLQRETKDFALTHDALGIFITNRYLFMEEFEFIDSVLDNVINYDSEDVDLLRKRSNALHRVAIGEPYTDISQFDTSGVAISLSSLISKHTLVDFWASWCGPCRAQNPDLVDMYRKWSNKFEIVGVAFDQDPGRWKKAILEDGLTWPQMSDLKGWGNSAAELYSIRAIPQNILIDPEGIIVARNIEIPELGNFLMELE